MAPLSPPLAHSKFSLDSSGVAGFFGGDEAISAMATVHLYKGRRWLGWFNSPGSYTIAKTFGRMANTPFWDGLFPGPNDPPAAAFGLCGKRGPQYISVFSGTNLITGHLGFLTVERSKEMKRVKLEGRKTTPYDITYLAMDHVDYSGHVEKLPIDKALLGLIPITTSVVTCVMCALVYDWFSFSMILFGIVSSGLASAIIGKGRLVIESVKEPAPGSPPGHGIMKGDDGVIVIKGEECDVNVVTKGHFVLEMETGILQWFLDWLHRAIGRTRQAGTANVKVDEDDDEECTYHAIGICSLILLVQFLLQLLLIPQGTLFGQIMFLVSLGVSWMYNSYLSSFEKEKIQAQMLFQKLGNPQMLRFRAGTRTTMAVFVCLLLFHGVKPSSEEEDTKHCIEILQECLPNSDATDVWRSWREKVIEQLLDVDDHLLFHLADNEEDPQLLRTLLKDARTAFEEYFHIRGKLPVDSATRKFRDSGIAPL